MLSIGYFNSLSGVRHAFFSKKGGVSGGIYDSLNCGFGSGDATEAVAQNRTIAMRNLGLPAERLVTCYQHHSSDVVEIKEPLGEGQQPPKADAMVTKARRVALGILTADCAPVIFADAQAGVVGAAHAGWRGALGGVLENTIDAMIDLGAQKSRIAVGVGPCISHRVYEVSPDFLIPFLEQDPYNQRYFAQLREGGKPHFDLKRFIARRLDIAGIEQVDVLPSCTYTEKERFFSYRRNTHAGEKDYGRLLSAIYLEAY